MAVKIGIPRSLLFYIYYPLWKTFFEGLGAEVIASGNTNKAILKEGLSLSVDEACLPVKVAFGHVGSLRDKVDFIFIPRLVSVSPGEYICPKFLGFPDMVRQCVKNLPRVIDSNINLYRSESHLYSQLSEIGRLITGNPIKISMAYKRAVAEMRKYKTAVEEGLSPDTAFEGGHEKNTPVIHGGAPFRGTVALIGHPYNVYDSYINIGLLKRLKDSGINVVTSDNVPEKDINRCAGTLEKKLFWTLGRRAVGAAYYYMDRPDICGIIHLASFACGPDSMTGEIIERKIR
ncbi:MAG: acyl-CoA dehydratase activase-related protein, partial [Desulfocucumaceae bacterium]